MSAIPNSAGLSPGTTRNLHLATLSLCFNFADHTPNCSMFELLYGFNMIAYLIVAHNASIVDFGNKDLNISNDTTLSLGLELIVMCALL